MRNDTGLALDVGVEADTLNVLHDDVHVIVGFDYIVDLQNVTMVYFLQDFYLSANALAALNLLDLLLFVDLDRYLFIVWLVYC